MTVFKFSLSSLAAFTVALGVQLPAVAQTGQQAADEIIEEPSRA